MFKEPAYWMYYFWSKNKRARKDAENAAGRI